MGESSDVRRKRVSGMMGMPLSRVARYCLEQDGKWGSYGHPVVVFSFLTHSEGICVFFPSVSWMSRASCGRVLNSSLRVRRCFAGSSRVLPSSRSWSRCASPRRDTTKGVSVREYDAVLGFSCERLRRGAYRHAKTVKREWFLST